MAPAVVICSTPTPVILVPATLSPYPNHPFFSSWPPLSFTPITLPPSPQSLVASVQAQIAEIDAERMSLSREVSAAEAQWRSAQAAAQREAEAWRAEMDRERAQRTRAVASARDDVQRAKEAGREAEQRKRALCAAAEGLRSRCQQAATMLQTGPSLSERTDAGDDGAAVTGVYRGALSSLSAIASLLGELSEEMRAAGGDEPASASREGWSGGGAVRRGGGPRGTDLGGDAGSRGEQTVCQVSSSDVCGWETDAGSWAREVGREVEEALAMVEQAHGGLEEAEWAMETAGRAVEAAVGLLGGNPHQALSDALGRQERELRREVEERRRIVEALESRVAVMR